MPCIVWINSLLWFSKRIIFSGRMHILMMSICEHKWQLSAALAWLHKMIVAKTWCFYNLGSTLKKSIFCDYITQSHWIPDHLIWGAREIWLMKRNDARITNILNRFTVVVCLRYPAADVHPLRSAYSLGYFKSLVEQPSLKVYTQKKWYLHNLAGQCWRH